jgi:hypothetical protein
MMSSNSKTVQVSFWFTYLITLGLALFFAKGVTALHPPHFLAILLAASGLLLCGIFLFISRNQKNSSFVLFAVFQVLQGVLGFAVSRYVFNLPVPGALLFPAGAVLSLFTYGAVAEDFAPSAASVLLSFFLTGGLAVGLRLHGVFGGLIYTLALLNGFWLGGRLFSSKILNLQIWQKALFFAGVLAVARAVIQYYLLESNYASLGVVITHPYTFVALFAGLLVPSIFGVVQRDQLLPWILNFLLLGVLLPIVLGIFLHVRPMAGYLMGLAAGSFIVGILLEGTYGVGWLTYLSLGIVTLSLPLFKELTNLNRLIRLEILGGVMILAVIFYLIFSSFQSNKLKSAT